MPDADLPESEDGPTPRYERREHPLGTAAWHRFDPERIPYFKRGDIWLSHLPDGDGDAIGIRDDRHVLIVAGTRGGKGASFVIPNVCTWPGSIVVIDPKGETAMVTARRRGSGSLYCEGMGQKVYLLDPFRTAATDADDLEDVQACFNPLDLLHPDREESVDEAVRIAAACIISEKSSDPFWPNSATALMRDLNLHVASSSDFLDEERNLLTVRKLLKVGHDDIKALLDLNGTGADLSGMDILFAHMKQNPAFGGLVAHAGERYARMVATTPKLFESIVQTALTDTDFMDSPAMQRCLAKSTFALHELKTDPKGVSLFLSLPQRYMKTHYCWLRMMTDLITAEMERVNKPPATGHQVLMVLDEFAALKRMTSIENAAAQIAGFGVKLVMVVQNLGQLRDNYKENWETLVGNAGIKLFFNNEDHFTQDYASKLAGDCEVIRTTRTSSDSGSRTKGFSTGTTTGNSASASYGAQTAGSNTFGSSSSQMFNESASVTKQWSEGHSKSPHKRALIDPSEIGRLFGNPDNPAALALIGGCQPIALRRTFYFADFRWAGLYNPHRAYPLPMRLTQVRLRRIEMKHEAELAARRREEERLAKAARERERDEDARIMFARERKRLAAWEVFRKTVLLWWAASVVFLIVAFPFVREVKREGLTPAYVMASVGYDTNFQRIVVIPEPPPPSPEEIRQRHRVSGYATLRRDMISATAERKTIKPRAKPNVPPLPKAIFADMFKNPEVRCADWLLSRRAWPGSCV